MRPLRSRPAGEAWLGAGLLAAVTLAAALGDPTHPGRFPTCPFHALTGLDCPGCGTLRALYELAHGHVVSALDHNAFLVVFLPLGALAWLRAVTGSRSPSRVHPGWAWLALVVAWGVIRNLPLFGGALAA
ncbi:DUF2752 domain-containing protein [Streptomyces griseorubiginosus]|uniref:DUF2752 domain-containing protein n=1 Tax=Streptomyces griseorubiginosus TaxID=67304 RepID=UPI0027E2221E|nr:DUF2752 domain-containing protein [Streptomyces griseorubiginosus]MBO4257510.1 DUF2752 domain-containing protein [Streptomyces griseorubiginosus]